MIRPFPYIGCPDNMRRFIDKVLGGEYDIPSLNLQFESDPTILDLGANIGSFAYWALGKYPSARVISFEPNDHNCAAYRANMLATEAEPWSYHLVRAAVWPTHLSEMTLFE